MVTIAILNGANFLKFRYDLSHGLRIKFISQGFYGGPEAFDFPLMISPSIHREVNKFAAPVLLVR